MSEQEQTIPTPTEEISEQVHDDHGGGHGLAGFEPENLNVWMIMGVVFGTSLVVIALIVVGFAITSSYAQKNEAVMLNEAAYPEIRDIRAADMAELNRTGVVDDEDGIYRITIDQAMELMVNMQYKNPDGDFTDELSITPQ